MTSFFSEDLMISFRNVASLVAVLVGAAVLGAPTRANADFQLTLQSGAQTIYINDNNTLTPGTPVVGGTQGTDLDSALSSIQVNQNLGSGLVVNAKITGTNNQTDPFTGLPPSPLPDEARLATTAITIRNTSAGTQTLVVTLSASDYTFPSGNPLTLFSSASATASNVSIGANAITFQSYADDANNLYGGTTFALSGGAVTTGPQVSGSVTVGAGQTLDIPFTPGTNSVLFPGAQPFSMTEQITFVLGAGANVTFNGQSVVSVPAPAGLVLAATALPFFGLGVWRRRQKTKAPAA